MPPPPEKRARAGRFAVLLASTVAALLAGELVCKAYLYRFASDSNFLKFASIKQLQENERFSSNVVRHTYLGYVLKSGYSKGDNRINALGFRGAEIPTPKPAGEFRVVCMGGSTTYGTGISDWSLAYPARLEFHLRSRFGDQFRVINAGVPGFSSWETLGSFLFRVLDLQPDLVIVYHGVNGILPRFTWPHEKYLSDNSNYRTSTSQVYWPSLFEHSDLFRTIAVATGLTIPHSQIERQFGGPGNGYVGYRGQPEEFIAKMLAANPPIYFERNLANLGVVARHHGVRVLFLTFAHCTLIEGLQESRAAYWAAAHQEMNLAVRDAAAECGAALFDFAAVFPEDLTLFSDSVHMTEAGCERQAGILADYLETSGLLGE